MRIDKLLLELDPRKDNTAALERARSIASSFEADVDVVIWEPPQVVPAPAITEPAIIAFAQQDHRPDIEEWAKAKTADLVDAGIEVNVAITEEQPRYEAILRQADASGADLIIRVVGEHGRLKRLFLGTTDWDLIRHSKQPLWLVQAEGADDTGASVMAAVDPMHPKDELMKLDKRLVDFADGLSKALSGSLHVYHTYQTTPVVAAAPSGAALTPPEPQVDVDLLKKIEAAHKASLDKLVSGYELTDSQVHLLEGDPAARIDDVIKTHGIGVVVAGAISRSWLDRLLVGSTAETFLDAVSCDLVLLKAEES